MTIKRIFAVLGGLALFVAGAAGLAFCIGGLVILPRLERQVEVFASDQIETYARALSATLDGLLTAEDALVQATEAVDGLEGIMADVGRAINGAAPVLDVAAELLGEQLPSTIQSTQETLTSVATSAQLVDDILGVISVIPLLGTELYNPEISLNQGVRNVSSGLDRIPELLLTAGEGLNAGSESLQDAEEGFAEMGQSISETMNSLESAQVVLEDYQEIVSDLQGTLSSVQDSLPRWLQALRWGLTLVLIWLGMAQIGLMTLGWDLVGRRD
jgi:methyl-accepting chemotaxis protein